MTFLAARTPCTWDSSCSPAVAGIDTPSTAVSTRHCPPMARDEYTKELRRIGIDAATDQPKDLVSLTVSVARVLDLTDAARRNHFGVALETLTGDTDDDLESCRIVADLARLEGYDAILSPSAALDVARNLNLYIDGRADHLRLMDGPDRIALNY